MVVFKSGRAGGLPHSRALGTKVMLAGRTAFLPNDNVPFVMQKLTKGQIDAIPKNKFTVSLIEPVRTPVLSKRGYGRSGKGTISHLQRMKTLASPDGGGGSVSFVRRSLGDIKLEDKNGTETYNTIVSMVAKVQEKVDVMYDQYLVLSRNQRETPLKQDSGIFCSPVDEGCMTDCIKKAICHFFGNNDTGRIVGRECKLVLFCLLMHDYFVRAKILNNETYTPFCNYLLENVLTEREKTFTPRTFTNCANDHKEERRSFDDPEKLHIDFDIHPKASSNQVRDAFHEIGNFFHTSDYFTHLRTLQTNMAKFRL